MNVSFVVTEGDYGNREGTSPLELTVSQGHKSVMVLPRT